MDAAASQLRLLLALAPVGPDLRREARRALASRRPEAIWAAGRRVIAHLERAGRLVPVSGGPAGQFLLQDHSGVLDLAALSPGASPEQTVRIPTDRGHGLLLRSLDEQERLLSAMESVQRLPVTAAHADADTAVLAELLALLRPCFPDLHLALLLFDPDVTDDWARAGIVPLAGDADHPWWLRERVPGEACYLEGAMDLPAKVCDALGVDADQPVVLAAIPLYGPSASEAGGTANEVGLLLLGATTVVPRDHLIRLGARLARFVADGWRRQQAVRLLVHTDGLTGLRNRGFFDLQFPLELERARRRETPLVLILGDIDHFKAVNDTHGHLAGDAVLRAVARELQNALRRIDLVCRVGGEEFALVLPDTDRTAAVEVITRLLVRVANLRQVLPGSDEPLRVTMSFGAVAFPEGGTVPESLYRRADGMLYLSKARGRNRCHVWKPDGDPLPIVPGYQSS